MAHAEEIESFGRFRAARIFAPAETLRNYSTDPPETEVGSASAVRDARGLLFAEISNWGYEIDPGNKILSRAGNVTTRFTTFVFDISGSGPVTDESSTTQVLTIGGVSDETADQDEEPSWIGDMEAVLKRARKALSREIHDRLKKLSSEVLDEDNTPLQGKAAGWFVHYCMCRGIKQRPLMTVTPTGELDATWHSTGTETVVIRFFPTGTVWVAHTLKFAKGSFEATVMTLASKDFPFRFPDWANA